MSARTVSSASEEFSEAPDELAEVSLAEAEAESADSIGAAKSGSSSSWSAAEMTSAADDFEVPETQSDDTVPPDLDVEGSGVVSAVVDVLNPLADGKGPAAPGNSPADWAVAAVARRDLSLEKTGIQSAAALDQGTSEVVSAGIFGNPITVAPVVPELFDGILQGVVDAESSRGFELTYSVLSDATQGGKVNLINSTTCQTIASCADAFPDLPADSGEFTLLPDLSVVNSGGTAQFSVLIAEQTPFDEVLAGLPVLGFLAPTILETLHQIPIVKDILAPLIGYSVVEKVTVDVGALAPVGTPVGFTVDVISFDGTPISTNYIPVSGQVEGGLPAPTLLNGPGLGSAGYTDVYGPEFGPSPEALPGPSIATVRAEGYNYVSWDPRGEHASGGILQLDNPFFEGRDVNHIIDFLVANNLTATDGTTPNGSPDPLLGMLGGSYGGGIQWVVAGIDQRIDAIVPGIAWNSLNEAIYPEDAFKTAWADLLFLALELTGARINSQIPAAILTGNLFAWVSETAQAVLTSAGPTVLVDNITAPSLLLQGTADGLFVLEQSIQNAEITDANGIPTKMIWFCGGHGMCLNPVNPNQNEIVAGDTMDWLNRFVMGETPPEAPNFQFFDQNGDHFSSDLFPFDPAFIGGEIVTEGDGGFLAFVPVIGGSGPSSDVPAILGFATASEANNALNLEIEAPLATTQVVGAPELSFTYSGFGTAHFLYGQIVDDTTGLVLGNLVKPIPVTLDGKTRTVTIDLENIVYTMDPQTSLKLQVTGSATPYESPWAWGGVNVSDVELKLPTVADGVATLESTGP